MLKPIGEVLAGFGLKCPFADRQSGIQLVNQAQQAADIRPYQVRAARDFLGGKKVRIHSKINTQVFLIGYTQIHAIVEFATKTGQADGRRG